MSHLIPILHWFGTKPLVISVVAQLVTIGISPKKGDRSQVREHLILIAALVLIIVSLDLRPPSPVNLLADGLGFLAALLLAEPAVYGLRHLRSGGGGK